MLQDLKYAYYINSEVLSWLSHVAKAYTGWLKSQFKLVEAS